MLTWQSFWDVIYHHHRALRACETLKGDAALGKIHRFHVNFMKITNDSRTTSQKTCKNIEKHTYKIYRQTKNTLVNLDLYLCDKNVEKKHQKSRRENVAARIVPLFSRRDLPRRPRSWKESFPKKPTDHQPTFLTSYWAPAQSTRTKMTANGFSSYELFVKKSDFSCISQ